MSRVQFTPDLMPSDVTGVSIYDRQTSRFEFRPGPVFANIVVADEINRASPKTQSALLECMEERQVTVDGTTYRLARPFLVLATQNPVEMEGTYPLPEAQRDRFLARLTIGYPDRTAEIGMLADRDRVDPLDQLRAGDRRRHDRVAHRRGADRAPRAGAAAVPGGDHRRDPGRAGGPARRVAARRAAPGAGPRRPPRRWTAGRSWCRTTSSGSAIPVLAHRLLLTVEAHAAHRSAEEIVSVLLSRIRVPRGA